MIPDVTLVNNFHLKQESPEISSRPDAANSQYKWLF